MVLVVPATLKRDRVNCTKKGKAQLAFAQSRPRPKPMSC